jgi:hypothetical protein
MGLLWGIAVACGGPEPVDDSSGGSETDSDATSETGSTTDTDTSPACTGELSGTARDAAGDPYAAIDLRFCRPIREGGACRYATTDDAGAYAFDRVCAGPYSLEFQGPEDSDIATIVFPVQVDDGEQMTADGYLVPLDAASPLGSPEAKQLGAGLHVTVGTGDLETPLFKDDATEVAGVSLTGAQIPPVDGATTVAAAWATSPFDYAAPDGLPATIDNLWALPEGSEWHVWVASYGEALWLDAGTLTVTGGALAGTVELPLLSTVALVQ